MSTQRVASVIRLLPEKEADYRALHAQAWPAVLERLREVGVTNYSIFLRDGLLFSYLEYVGDDYDDAMRQVAQDSATKEWWKLTDPCQQPVESAPAHEWWAVAEEIFHLD
jgi:L-rhamnose mutarotase